MPQASIEELIQFKSLLRYVTEENRLSLFRQKKKWSLIIVDVRDACDKSKNINPPLFPYYTNPALNMKQCTHYILHYSV